MMLIHEIHVFELQIETKFKVYDQRACHRPTLRQLPFGLIAQRWVPLSTDRALHRNRRGQGSSPFQARIFSALSCYS